MHKNAIKHTLTPPYHPQSNGAAERAVRIVKVLVKHVLEGNKSRSIKHRLPDFLLRYRTTPHSTTGVMPAELLMRCRLHRRLERFSFERRKVIGFAITIPHDWLKKLAPHFHPIRSKTNRDSLARVFPRFALATCNYYEF